MTRTWHLYAKRIIGGLALLFLLLGTVVYRAFEDWSWIDSAYFSVVTLTTVGFGDLHPTMDGSKVFTIFYIVGGVSLIGLFLNELLKGVAKRMADRGRPDGAQDG